MQFRRILGATAVAVSVATTAWAADIQPIINVATTQANDLRGLTFGTDGKIYASGHAGTTAAEQRTVVARFNADGTPDASFGVNGFAHVDVAPERGEQSLGVAVLGGGDVVVAVNALDAPGGQSVYLVRFAPDGTQRVAPQWGDAQGRVEVVFGWANANNAAFPGTAPPSDTAWDLQVDRSGSAERLVVFGFGPAPQGTNRTDSDRYVVRLHASNGAVDPTFNQGRPFVYHSAGTLGDNQRRGLVEADGSIVSSGYTNLGTGLGNHVILFKLTPAGTLDPSFGNFLYPAGFGAALNLTAQPGVAVFNPFRADGGVAETYGIAKLADGSYVTTGYGVATATGVLSSFDLQSSTGPDVVTFHVIGNTFDTAWGIRGAQAIQSEGRGRPTTEDRGRALVALADGRTLQVGRFGGIAAVFVLTAAGQLDTTVDGDGILELGHPDINSQFFNVALSPDGTRIALTTDNNAAGARLVVLEVR